MIGVIWFGLVNHILPQLRQTELRSPVGQIIVVNQLLLNLKDPQNITNVFLGSSLFVVDKLFQDDILRTCEPSIESVLKLMRLTATEARLVECCVG